jgi:glucoside 3-dehydrogenase (cytochrome c) hitch-hiker subunit
MDRREALRRVALMLGGTISAPALAGLLAGCEKSARAPGTAWVPRAVSPEHGEMIAVIADLIIPTTDTPGARAVGVHEFIDTMLADYYDADDRARFAEGLDTLDARARSMCGEEFVRCAPERQIELLARLDHVTFVSPRPETSFYRMMKELTLLGYYTSETGATRELRHAAVPGHYEGCVPFTTIGRTWAV